MAAFWGIASHSAYDKFSLAVPEAERLRALDHLTAVSGVGSSTAPSTCETSDVLLACVPDGFSRGSPVFAQLPIGSSRMS